MFTVCMIRFIILCCQCTGFFTFLLTGLRRFNIRDVAQQIGFAIYFTKNFHTLTFWI